MKFEITNRWTGSVQFTAEIDCGEDTPYGVKVGLAVKWAIRNSANLRAADLSAANLRDADLRDADLSAADLRDADLSAADLRDANLRDANLRDANLRDANLRDANLSAANLRDVRADFISEVLKLPNELEFLRDALIGGKVDGSTYSGECACLAGTLAHARGIAGYNGESIKNGCTFIADARSPRERFFLAIKKGHKPENSSACKIALAWTNEAIAIRDNIRAYAMTAQAQASSNTAL